MFSIRNLYQSAKNAVVSVGRKALTVVASGAAALGLVSAPKPALAVPPTTIAELTTAISFADVGLGILAVAALLAAVYVTWKGAKMVIAAVRGL